MGILQSTGMPAHPLDDSKREERIMQQFIVGVIGVDRHDEAP
jgi:hypothetical protein